MSRRKWTNVRFYRRKDGTKVRAHRRRVQRKIPKRIVDSFHELSKDKKEYGIGVDYQSGYKDVDSISILPGEEEWTMIPSQSKITLIGDESLSFDRDYELIIHTHPKGTHGAYRFPSSADIINFIADTDNKKREYALIIMENEAVILHIPQSQRKKILNETDFRDDKIYQKTVRKMNYKYDRVGSRKEMRALIREWEKKYGFSMTRIPIEKLSNYEFKIIPQGKEN